MKQAIACCRRRLRAAHETSRYRIYEANKSRPAGSIVWRTESSVSHRTLPVSQCCRPATPITVPAKGPQGRQRPSQGKCDRRSEEERCRSEWRMDALFGLCPCRFTSGQSRPWGRAKSSTPGRWMEIEVDVRRRTDTCLCDMLLAAKCVSWRVRYDVLKPRIVQSSSMIQKYIVQVLVSQRHSLSQAGLRASRTRHSERRQ